MDHTAMVREFLQRYAKALSTGEVDVIADCWAVPALVVSDEGAIAVSSADQVRQFFTAAVDAYHSQGLDATKPSSFEVVELAGRILSVDVQWSGQDASGQELTREHSHYLLHLDETGHPRIRVAVARPVDSM